MELKTGILALAIVLAIVVVAWGVPYVTICAVRGICLYFRTRGAWRVTCPEAGKTAFVRVAGGSIAEQAFLDQPCLRLSECSRWPLRGTCGQDCLEQIQAAREESRGSASRTSQN